MVRMSAKNKRRAAEIGFICTMLALPIASFLIFWLYVNFNSILMAFQLPNYSGDGTIIWSFDNFKNFFVDLFSDKSVIGPAIRNTLLFFGSNVFIVIPVAVFMCYFLFKEIFMYRFFRFVFFLPSIIMATVLVVLFKFIINEGGPVQSMLIKMGKDPIPFLATSRYALKTILFYTIFTSFGGNLVLLSGAMKTIDESVLEAAKLDGAGMMREIFQIIIPLIWPTLSTMLILASVGIFTSSGPILLFRTDGKKGTNTIAYYIFQLVSGEGVTPNNEYASAVGLVFTAIGFPIVLIIKKLLTSIVAEVEY